MFTHVSVWLDDDNEGEAAFQQALEWAFLLRLPLRGCSASARESDGLPVGRWNEAGFSHAAAGKQVEWNRVFFDGDRVENMRKFIGSQSLSVCAGRDGPGRAKRKLPHLLLDCVQSSMMFVSPIRSGMQRVLVLDHETIFRSAFFESAAKLCARLGVEPVILTVARDELAAQQRRESLASVVGKHLHRAELDLVLGSDLAEAVHLVAGCRGCSHVIVENTAPHLRNRWWRRDPIDDLHRKLGDLGMLVLPRPAREFATENFGRAWQGPASQVLKTNALGGQ